MKWIGTLNIKVKNKCSEMLLKKVYVSILVLLYRNFSRSLNMAIFSSISNPLAPPRSVRPQSLKVLAEWFKAPGIVYSARKGWPSVPSRQIQGMNRPSTVLETTHN